MKKVGVLIFAVLLLFIINYSFLDKALINFVYESDEVLVIEVTDGDTLKIKNASVRLLGINTPERGEVFYSEAKQFLTSLVFNKSVKLELSAEKYDKYGRILAYVYLENKNINLEMIKTGFANPDFPSGKDSHYKNFFSAWNNCLSTGKNLCKKSNSICANCIIFSSRNSKNKSISLSNSCSFECNLSNWTLKEEGRDKFLIENEKLLPSQTKEFVVGNLVGTIYLRDSEGNFVTSLN